MDIKREVWCWAKQCSRGEQCNEWCAVQETVWHCDSECDMSPWQIERVHWWPQWQLQMQLGSARSQNATPSGVEEVQVQALWFHLIKVVRKGGCVQWSFRRNVSKVWRKQWQQLMNWNGRKWGDMIASWPRVAMTFHNSEKGLVNVFTDFGWQAFMN